MKKGIMTQLSNSAPSAPASPPPQSPTTASGKYSKAGFIVTIIGVLITFIAAVVYLATGDSVPGIVGILFVIIMAVFLRRGQNSTDIKTKQLAGLIPFFFGWIIMILIGTVLAFDPLVLAGGLLLVMGGITLVVGK
jgi:membrane protein implicated in regulation of membrane protease activity